MAVGTVPTCRPAVAPVHEQVQQQARRYQQERQKAEEVGAVLGKEEKGGHRQKAKQGPFPL